MGGWSCEVGCFGIPFLRAFLEQSDIFLFSRVCTSVMADPDRGVFFQIANRGYHVRCIYTLSLAFPFW